MRLFLIYFLLNVIVAPAQAQTPNPQLLTIAGTGTSGYNGDDQAASQAQLHYPHGLAIDQAGNVYIADQHNQRIRKINSQTGIITTAVGNGIHKFGGDGEPATQANLGAPRGVFIAPNGHLFIADTDNNRIRKVDKDTGIILTAAGNGQDGFSGDGVLATQATLWHPREICVTSTEDIYIADTENNRIRKVDGQTGFISTVAGTGEFGFSGDGDLATNASLGFPSSVLVTDTGDIYILDFSNHRIRRVDAQTGIIQTVGPTQNNGTPLGHPNAFIRNSDESIYVSDSDHNRILKLENNNWSVIGGTGQPGFSDGTPLQATLYYPSGIAIDKDNTLYITDRFNHSVRKITHVNQVITQPLQPNDFRSLPLNPPPPKTAPIAIPDTVEVKPNSRINVYVLRNDYDNEGDPLTVTNAIPGTNSERVIINDNGTIHYRPLPNFEGEDQFSYTISDGNGGTATAQVFITVIDRPPIVNHTIRTQSFFLGEQSTIDLGGSQPVILDPQGEPLRLSATSQDSTIAIPTINVYQLSIVGQKAGRTTIQITGTDSIGQSASTKFDIIFKDPNPQIGELFLGTLFNTFEKRFRNNDLVALTGPVTVDTLGGKNQGYQYLSTLSQKIPENAILALRQNYEQIWLWQLLRDVRIRMSFESLNEQVETAEISANMYFESFGRPTPRSQPFIDLPPEPISLQAIKISSGWVIDNVPEIIDHTAQMIGADQWPKVKWKIPDLIISPNSPPIIITLNTEPHLFQAPNEDILVFSTRGSFITGFPGVEATVQDTLLTLTPVSWGDNMLTITADNASEGTANLHFFVQVKREVPITVSDTAQVRQGEHINIPVLQNDRALANETLQIVSTTQGAKSNNIQILNRSQIRYTPKIDAIGTDRFTYRIDDGKGNQADGFVFVYIQAKKITPDFNSDGKVDFSDFILFAAAFGSSDANYDLDDDGQVTFLDFIIFGRAFGS